MLILTLITSCVFLSKSYKYEVEFKGACWQNIYIYLYVKIQDYTLLIRVIQHYKLVVLNWNLNLNNYTFSKMSMLINY